MSGPRIIADRPTRTDVLVIGSGPVGSAAATELVRRHPTARVLILEVGPTLTPTPGVNLKNVPDADLRLELQTRSQGPQARPYGMSSLHDRTRGSIGDPDRLARPGTFLLEQDLPEGEERGEGETVELRAASLSANVGGMGVHWTCATPWPYGDERPGFLDAATLDDLLADARALLHVTHDAYPRNAVGDAVLAGLREAYPDAPADRAPNTMPLAVTGHEDGRREWTGPATIFGAAREAGERITVRPDALARQLIVDGDQVRGAVVEDRRTGEEWTVHAAAVIVAADAFRTPQLLWASGVRPSALGHYLNDHTQVMGLARVDLRDARPPAPVGAEDPLIGVYWMPYSEAHPFHAQIMQFDLSPISLEEESRPDDAVPTVGIGMFVPKDIQYTDAVIFSDDKVDAYGMPRMSIRYRLTDADNAALAEARHYLERSAAAVGELVGDGAPLILEPGSSLHYQGTFRMGAVDDGTSVCDPDSRVWSFRNLFLGGNGIIPTPTAGNPTLTSVALVLQAARRIAALLDHDAA